MDVRWGEQKEVDRKRRKTIDDIMVAGGRELIDTLWNVNLRGYGCIQEVTLELIDTLWNVNAFVSRRWVPGIDELIDTLWNVNKDGCEYVAVDFTN